MSEQDSEFVNSFGYRILPAIYDDLSILLESTKHLRRDNPDKEYEDIYLYTVEDKRTGLLATPKFSSSVFSMRLPEPLQQPGTAKNAIYQFMRIYPQNISGEIMVLHQHDGQLLIGYANCPELSLVMNPYGMIQLVKLP